MSDADSESEYSYYEKKHAAPERYLLRHRRRSKKNKFQESHRRKKSILLGAVVLVSLTLVLIFITLPMEESEQNEELVYRINTKVVQKSILVLNWHNKVSNYGEERGARRKAEDGVEGTAEGPEMVLTTKNCKIHITNTTNIPQSDWQRYNAIILNSTAENVLLGIDAIKRNTNNDNNIEQILIFATQKPIHYHNLLSEDFYIKNFSKTLTYTLNADFVWQPYKIVRKNDTKIVAPSRQPPWHNAEGASNVTSFESYALKESFLSEIKETSPLALAVLHGPCVKVRQELIERMREHMEVHTYGECGEYKYKCPNSTNCQHLPRLRDNKRYKFYFAFESELCVDYVGEHFFQALNDRLVPVVLGGANYSHFAPPYSYINANSFPSIRELAEYLLFLDQNPEEHVQYFAWHETYKIEKFEFDFQQICDYLVETKVKQLQENATTTTTKIVDWLRESKCETYEMPVGWRS